MSDESRQCLIDRTKISEDKIKQETNNSEINGGAGLEREGGEGGERQRERGVRESEKRGTNP